MSYSTDRQCVVSRLQLRAVAARCKYDWLRLQGVGEKIPFIGSINCSVGIEKNIAVCLDRGNASGAKIYVFHPDSLAMGTLLNSDPGAGFSSTIILLLHMYALSAYINRA